MANSPSKGASSLLEIMQRARACSAACKTRQNHNSTVVTAKLDTR